MFVEEKCTVCGECVQKCFYLAYDEEKAKTEFKKLIDGEPTSITTDCITCAACNEICPEGANPFDLINARQEETDTFGNKGSAKMMEGVKFMPSSVIKGDPGKPVMSLCTVDMVPGVVEGKLFEGLTVIKGGDYFCQIGWIHAGKPSMVKKNAQQFVDNVAKVVPKGGDFICYHDDCYCMIKHFLKEYEIDVPFNAIHIIEFMRDYVKKHPDQVKKLNIKIAYQEPCASRYTFHETNSLLDELFELIGVERVTRKYDRGTALCCGGVVAGMEALTKEEKDRGWKENIKDAKDAGAEAMVMLCPLCNLYLRSKAKAQGMEPYMLVNLVRLALGETLTHGGAGKIYN